LPAHGQLGSYDSKRDIVKDSVRDMSEVFVEYGLTVLHPATAVFMLCMVALAVFSKRSRVIVVVVLVCVFIPYTQRIVVAGLDFNMLRLILIVAWIRVLLRGEHRGFTTTKVDRVLVAWTLLAGLMVVLRRGGGGIVSALGTSVDALTAFFLFRVLIRTRIQVFLLSRQLVWITGVLAVFMAFELAAEYNVFSTLGGVPPEPQIRGGRVRCQGAFSHPILVGTFAATLIPIFIAGFRGRKKDRMRFAAGVLMATIVVATTGSSGPVIAWIVGLLGWAIWRQRSYMRAALWVMAGMAIVVHFVREKPVWSLIGRISSVTGGTGYHRYRLIDAFITRFNEWALVGIDNTAHWGWGLQDVTNQYVAEGERGGLLTLVLFIVLLHASFSKLRGTRMRFERIEGPKSLWPLLAWGFSVSLAVQCVSFLSVSYFGQMVPFFVMFLALIPALARPGGRARAAPKVAVNRGTGQPVAQPG